MKIFIQSRLNFSLSNKQKPSFINYSGHTQIMQKKGNEQALQRKMKVSSKHLLVCISSSEQTSSQNPCNLKKLSL